MLTALLVSVLLSLSLSEAKPQFSLLQPVYYLQPRPLVYQVPVGPADVSIQPHAMVYQLEDDVDSAESLATPLRAAVEAQPSSLVKAQTRILDLALKHKCPYKHGDCQPGFKVTCVEGTYKAAAKCGEFYLCVHEDWVRRDCGDGLHWNNNEKRCDWPEAAGCTEGQAGNEESGDTDAVISVPDLPQEAVIAEFPEWENPTTPSTTPAPSTTTQDWNKPWQPPTKPPRPDYDNRPLNNGLSGEYKIVCYFTNWATYRQTGSGKFDPEDIDHRICTHIIYGFAVLDSNTLLMKSHDPYADMSDGYSGKDMYRKVTEFKKHGIKVTLALGGWNDSKGDKYSRLVNNPAARAKFIEHAIKFIEKHDFDGLDLDWEYPSCWQTECKEERYKDKAAFTAWVRELSDAFKPRGLLLSAAVSPSKTIMDVGYDVPAISSYLDWINVMTYDYHGQWDKKTGHVAPHYEHPDDEFYYFNANFTMNYWIESGAPRKKLVMGMPLYGQSFTLNKVEDNKLNAPARGGGNQGVATRAKGFLAYHEICRLIKQGYAVVKDDVTPPRMGPYAYKGNQWVGFDDTAMIEQKCNYVKEMGLGGGMVWALDLDDFRNLCGEGSYPLMNTMRRVLG